VAVWHGARAVLVSGEYWAGGLFIVYSPNLVATPQHGDILIDLEFGEVRRVLLCEVIFALGNWHLKFIAMTPGRSSG